MQVEKTKNKTKQNKKTKNKQTNKHKHTDLQPLTKNYIGLQRLREHVHLARLSTEDSKRLPRSRSTSYIITRWV